MLNVFIYTLSDPISNDVRYICPETKEIYSSISDASRVLNIPISTIVGVLKKRRNNAKGFEFEYHE